MKIQIIDLLDYYYDDSVRLDIPETLSGSKSAPVSEFTAPQKTHRFRKPLTVAAAMVLVLTGAFAIWLGTCRDSGQGQALQEEIQPLETFTPPEALPEDSSREASDVSMEDAGMEDVGMENTASLQMIEGAYDSVDNICCYGNLLYVDGSYYTMTESGPEPIETQNLTTTVELYGTWDVDIDYAVVDGELVFRNKTSTSPYTIVDGEKIDLAEYYARYEERPDEYFTPNVAVAEPVAGSSDTVILQIYREDKSEVDSCAYTFFYNIFTGEIADPLSNVSELFDHGQMSYAQYNNSGTRALVNVFGIEQTSDGDSYMGDSHTYVCDLNTGEMVQVWELLEPYLPEVEIEGTEFNEGSGCRWADDDTLLFWVLEAVPNEGKLDSDGFPDPWDRYSWIFSYNVATGTLNYKQRNVAVSSIISNGNNPYVCDFADEEGLPFQVVDSVSGGAYVIDGATFRDVYGELWDTTINRAVLRGDDGNLYLVDAPQLGWANLSEFIEYPAEEIQSVRLLTDDWLCLGIGTNAYCFRIPEDLEMTPLAPK